MDRAVEGRACRDCDSKDFATVRERRGEGIMNRRICISAVFGGILVLSAGLAKAQETAPAPSEAVVITGGALGGDAMIGPFGGGIEWLGCAGLHAGKAV